MIEVGNHPGGIGAVMLHSTASGQFFSCERIELERLAAAIKRGDLDAFLGMRESSFVADGDADWTRPQAEVVDADDGLGMARMVALRIAAGRQPAPGDIELMAQVLIALSQDHPVGEQA